ncbi:MAG: tetratricopeptide repeat protein [Candidatus Obscuribacterales bacterium]|nr:tetratricopeptide repeat protein [Candidatus Obscuribacterales bacterium]
MKSPGKGLWLLVAGTIIFSCKASWAADSITPLKATPFRQAKLFKGRVTVLSSRAQSQLLNANYEKAEKSFRAALARNPHDKAARSGLGFALAMQFKLDGADSQLDQVLAAEADNALARTGKALVLLNRLQSSSGTVIKSRQAMMAEAESYARQAINSDPQMPESRYMLGSILKEEGRLSEAAEEFEKACRLDNQYSAAHAALGLTRLSLGQNSQARSELKRAIAINSKNSSAHYGLGKLSLQEGKADDAVRELNTALYLNRNSAPVHLALGEAYAMQGNTVGALREYQESIRIKPENPSSYMRIADLRESRGDLEHAIAELHSGLAMNPDSPELNQRVADLSLKAEKIDDAIKAYRSALALNPSSTVAVDGLSTALYMKTQKEGQAAFFASDDYESAEKQIQEAISLAPNNMILRLAQAKLRALSGEAVDFSGIREPVNDGERVAYAELMLSQNRFQEASQQFNTLIANAKDQKQTFAVADLACMLKDLDSAEAAYNKARAFPGSESRAKRGLTRISAIKDEARRHMTLAKDLCRRSQYNSAVDQLRAAIFNNPKDASARLLLAETIQKQQRPDYPMLRDASSQYKAYLALSPQLNAKEQSKIEKKISSIEAKASKMERKSLVSKR